jgi:hypothetical protein
MTQIIDALEKKLNGFVKGAKKRKKKAKKTKHERYFEGQQDAFEQVLIELKNLKYELESHETEQTDAVKEESAEKATEAISAVDDTEMLLQDAISKGVITRKTSFYFYDGFPNGKIQGKKNAFSLLKDEDLAAKVKQQIAETAAA